MLLGDKHAIPTQLATRFRTTGFAHALVISGLHVGLVALFLMTLLRIPDAPACLLTVILLGIYALVTQLQAPVVRASVMATIVLVGRALELRGSVLNSLGLAALVLMIAEPTSVLTLSFQLSFSATLAIISLHAPLLALLPERWNTESSTGSSTGMSIWGTWIVVPAAVSMAAQIGTMPIIVYHFQQLAPISLLANLLVVPLLGVAVAQGLLLGLVAPCWPDLGLVISGGVWLTVTLLMKTVDLFAVVPAWKLAQPDPTVAVGWMGLTVLAGLALYKPVLRGVVVMLLLIGANGWVWQREIKPQSLEVVFLDVGQGDGAFARLPDGKTMIVDGGMRSRRIDMGERVVEPRLRRQGIDEVDVVIASHPHADHIGGLVHLMEEIPVRHFVDAGQSYESWTARRLHELIREQGTRYHAVVAGDSLAGSSCILHEHSSTVQGHRPRDSTTGPSLCAYTTPVDSSCLQATSSMKPMPR